MSNPEREVDAPRPGDSPAEGAPRVLVINDEPTIRQILKIGLEAQGFDVSLAPNAQEGMNIVVSDPPALVILDLMMPQRDGWWFLREMQHHAGRRPLVIVLSARSGQGSGSWRTTSASPSTSSSPSISTTWSTRCRTGSASNRLRSDVATPLDDGRGGQRAVPVISG